jgi:hypothetical protein
LREGESSVLPGEEREEEEEGDMVGTGGVHWQRENAFLFQVALRPILPHGRAGPRSSHPIMNEWGGTWQFPATNLHEPQTFSTFSLPQTSPERKYSKNFFFGGVAEG